MIYLLAYFLALPFAVWFTAVICGLIDEPQPLKSLLRLVVSICMILLVLLFTQRDLWMAFLAAWVTVLCLHMVGFWWFRRRGMGATIYEQQPPPLPTLEDEST